MLTTKALMTKMLGRFKDIETLFDISKSAAITSTSMTTYAEGASITVPKGLYLIIYHWNFAGSGSGARQIQVAIKRNTETDLLGPHRITIGYGNYSIISNVEILEAPSDNTKFTVVASSDKTSSSASTTIKAVKLGGGIAFRRFIPTVIHGWGWCSC